MVYRIVFAKGRLWEGGGGAFSLLVVSQGGKKVLHLTSAVSITDGLLC